MPQRSERVAREELFPTTEELLTEGMGRRAFMARAAGLGLTATGMSVFLAACASLPEEGPVGAALSTPTLFPTPTPFPATPTPTPAAIQTPTLKATPTTEPTSTPIPTATPTPTPTPTPIASPLLSTELARVSHLVRRAGFGASPEELDGFVDMGLDDTVDYLLDYEKVDNSGLDKLLSGLELDLEKRLHLQRWWIIRMVHSKRPLQEKMTLFYHGILTSSFQGTTGTQMLAQNNLFRDNALGRYDDMLKAISRDPAMLIWLDSRSNKKRAPNENYSRELMELFSLGIGHYTENDVRESARAFTGWEIRKNKFRFNPKQHDHGTKVFLGTVGDLNGDDVVDIIQKRPAAATYIVRRLFEFFAYDDPEPEVVERLAQIYRDNNTEIKPVVRAILTSDEFYSPQAARAIIKSPAELVATTARILKLETDSADTPLKMFPNATQGMGQELLIPPNVAGWPGGTTWINSTTLMQRVNFANLVATARNKKLRLNAGQLVQEAGAQTDEEQVDFFARVLLGGELHPEDRALLVRYLKSTDEAVKRPTLDEKMRSLVYLVLASPEYQLA